MKARISGMDDTPPPPLVLPPNLRPPSKVPLIALGVAFLGAAVLAFLQYQGRELESRLATIAKQEFKAAKDHIAEQDKRIEQLQAEKEALETAKAELAKSMQTKEGQLSEAQGSFKSFQEKMKDEIARGEIDLEETGGKLRVGVVDKILFDAGEAEISKRGEEVLARVAEALVEIPDKQIQVSGHTDRTPISGKLATQFPSNWELSAARAVHVVRFLAEKAKVPPERLVASGYGEFHPVASNKTSASRAKNRRIEILLTPMFAPVPKAKLENAGKKHADKGSAKKKGKPAKHGKKKH
jgi:chemotaxis protein MotB